MGMSILSVRHDMKYRKLSLSLRHCTLPAIDLHGRIKTFYSCFITGTQEESVVTISLYLQIWWEEMRNIYVCDWQCLRQDGQKLLVYLCWYEFNSLSYLVALSWYCDLRACTRCRFNQTSTWPTPVYSDTLLDCQIARPKDCLNCPTPVYSDTLDCQIARPTRFKSVGEAD